MSHVFLILLLLVTTCMPGRCTDSESAGKKFHKNGFAIAIAFPERISKIPTRNDLWNWFARKVDLNKDDYWGVGHAAVIIGEYESGELNYFDFGRYNELTDELGERPENYGITRSPDKVEELKLTVSAHTENKFLVNLDTILLHLGAKPIFQDYGKMEAAVYHDLDYNKMISFARELSDSGYIAYGPPLYEYCTRFVKQVIRKGGGYIPFYVYTALQIVNTIRNIYPVQ